MPIGAALLAAWSVLPLSVPLVGTNPAILEETWALWGWGFAITAGITIVLHILTRGRAAHALEQFWTRIGAIPRWLSLGILTLLFVALALAFTLIVFHGNARNVDGFAQLFQARIFLSGHLWLPPPRELASFATLQMILGPDRWFAQYPPGQPLVLAVGLAVGVWWLLNPLFAALLVVLTYRLASWVADDATGLVAAGVLCISPFALAVSGSEMSHLPAAVLGAGAAVAATRTHGRRAWLFAALAGGLLGVMTMFRPLDAVAAAIPVGVILLMAARRRIPAFGATALGGILCTLPTLAYNAATTGSWHTFGYTALWGPQHSLGFHPVPWGIPLTPGRAVGLTSLDLHQLNEYLLDLPFPVLVVLAAGLLLGRHRLGRRDAVPLVGVAALMGFLFFYWHRDVFYGPRFLFSALPWIVVLVARAFVLLGRVGAERPRLAVLPMALVVGLIVGGVMLTPARLEAYRESTPMLDLHPDRAAAKAGLDHAVVLIPDGWGTRLIARMWGLGIPVRVSGRFYGAIDACTLELALDRADADSAARRALPATLDSLARLGRPGVPAGVTDDPALRLLPGVPLPAACADEVMFDRRGFLAFGPFLYLNTASLDGPIVWARDLRDRNGPLRRRYPDRAFYRYAPTSPGGAPRLERLSP